MMIELTRSALPLGPAGHELGGHMFFDILISKVTNHDELGDILTAFQSYVLTDEWPAELGTVSDLVKLLHDSPA